MFWLNIASGKEIRLFPGGLCVGTNCVKRQEIILKDETSQ